MQLKFLYTLSLLFLVTIASSNECVRFNCPAMGKYKAACRASRDAGRGSETFAPAARKGETMTGCKSETGPKVESMTGSQRETMTEGDNDESGMATPLMRLLYI